MLYLKERSFDLEVKAFRKRKKIKQRLQDLLGICFNNLSDELKLSVERLVNSASSMAGQSQVLKHMKEDIDRIVERRRHESQLTLNQEGY